MPGPGVSFRSRRIIENPSPQKPLYLDKHSMNFLVAFLATFDVLIWGYDAVKIVGIIVHLAING